MYAVIDDRNQQYRVAPGDRIQIHYRKDAEEGAALTFDKVCCVGSDEGEGRIGAPHVDGASVSAKVVRQVKGDKIYIGKFLDVQRPVLDAEEPVLEEGGPIGLRDPRITDEQAKSVISRML